MISEDAIAEIGGALRRFYAGDSTGVEEACELADSVILDPKAPDEVLFLALHLVSAVEFKRGSLRAAEECGEEDANRRDYCGALFVLRNQVARGNRSSETYARAVKGVSSCEKFWCALHPSFCTQRPEDNPKTAEYIAVHATRFEKD